MSAGSPPSTRASTPSQKMKSRIFQHISPTTSKSGWLTDFIQAARILKEAAELVPVPYVKGVFGTVVVLLETVKMKENQDELRELCESTMRIAVFLRGQGGVSSGHIRPENPVPKAREFMTTVEIGFKAEEIHIAVTAMGLKMDEFFVAVVPSSTLVVVSSHAI
ncbi:hypothetical protein B0H19DRAFT_1259254 [Mycena capillaripes]|nr:hypothetical protein B0H19DRAFT_1259254 [Mycena capillaripes]